MNPHIDRRDQPLQGEDLPSLVIEAVLRTLWGLLLLGFRALRAGFRAPVMTGLALGVGALTYRHGWMAGLAALVALVGVLVVWRILLPGSYRTVVGPRLRALWRAPAYRARFPHVASRCGLYSQDSGSTSRGVTRETARLLKVDIGPAGMERLLIGLPAGLSVQDVESRLGVVTEALGARSGSLRVQRPGRVWLDLRRGDALARVVTPRVIASTDLRAVPVGLGEDGDHWCIRVQGTHTLIAGATGAGKGSVLWSLVAGLRPAIVDGTTEVWAIDPKGGMELGLGRGAFERFEGGDAESMCDLLEEAVELKTRRAMALSTAGIRTHGPRSGSPHIVIIVDELATLTAFAERPVVRRIEGALGLLLTQGRAVGISVIAAVQDPGKDVVSWRDLFPTRVAMRLDNPIQVDMVLGEGGRDRGAAADEISELTPGIAYVRIEGTRDIRRVRASYLDDEAVEALANEIQPWIRPELKVEITNEENEDHEPKEEMRQESS